MSDIRVRTNRNNNVVRVGQVSAVKVVASNQSAAVGSVDSLTNIGDVSMEGKGDNTFLMYDGTEYVHVTARRIVDISDGTQDDAFDAGSF